MVDAQVNMAAQGARIDSIEYKNLAPLYVDEPMTVCGRKSGDGKYEVWIENESGGVCVRGVAKASLRDI